MFIGNRDSQLTESSMVMNVQNSSTQIQNDQGAWIQDHEGKAGLLWNSFKSRMGVSTNISMHFDLNSLIHPTDFLQDI